MSQLERRKKMVKIYIFKALTSLFSLTSKLIRRMKKQESCLWRPNGLHEKVVTKSKLDIHFVRKIPLAIVIGQQMKEEGQGQNY